jgi:hypothetical protein
MTKNRRAPAGMEYVPITGRDKNFGFGVVRRHLGEIVNDVERFIWKKVHPTMKHAAGAACAPCCWRSDVLLPPSVPDIYDDPCRLSQQFEAQAGPAIKDLIVMTTFRFPDTCSLNAEWERVRAFGRQRLAIDRRLPVVLAMHNPRVVGGANAVHIHVMALARQLDGAGFGTVARELTNDRGRDLIAAEWADWPA